MKDPKTDDTAPLAPRRPLTGPAHAGSGQATAAPVRQPAHRPRHQAPEPRPGGVGGPPTTDLPRVASPSTAPPQRPASAPAAVSTSSAPETATTSAPPATASPRPRRARLRIVRVDPWSVMKVAFALSIALAIVTVVAVTIVWAVLGAAGVWDSINSAMASILSDNASDFDVTNYVGIGRVLGLTMIVAVADVILITAIATLGAFLYNLVAALLGGFEVTLAETR